jgi:hypothetical protein
MASVGRWQPGRLMVGWALGVLTTLVLMTGWGSWYEYRELSTAPGSGSSARRVTPTSSACQVDREGAITNGGYSVVPDQADPCYLRRPRIRPWQWPDGARQLIASVTGAT